MERVSKSPEKKSKLFVVFAIIISLILVLFTGYVIYLLLTLNILPEQLLIPVCLIVILSAIILLVLLNFASARLWSKILSSFLVIVMSIVMGFGSVYLQHTADTLKKVTEQAGKVKTTVSVISLASSSYEEIDDLMNKKIATLKNIDQLGTEKSLDDINSQDVKIEKVEYDNVPAQVKALYDGEVDAIVLNEVYRTNVSELENYSDFSNQTKVVYQTVFYTDTANEPLAVSDITTNPFNILITGNDSYGEFEEMSRSDVNMIVTVNPVTSTVLMTSIPRDYFVEEVCDDYACNYGVTDKLTHTGIYGVSTTKDTLENLLGIEINYTFRVNFSSMENIVDAIGGIDIEVAPGMAVSKFYSDSTLEGVTEGTNHLDGKRALAYSRERKAYLDGDTQRARNQQQVLEAIIDKVTSPTILTNYSQLLEALGNAFETNMTMDEITSLVQYQIQAMPKWNFEQYVLSGYGDMQVSPELGTEVSVVIPDANSVSIASQKIAAVLNGESSSTIESEEDVPAGTLSQEQIEAQIQEGLLTEGGYYYYDPYYYGSTQTYDDSTYYDPNAVTDTQTYGDGYYSGSETTTEEVY